MTRLRRSDEIISVAAVEEGAMYVAGVVLLSLGITLLILGGVALVAGAPVLWGLACLGCVPLPMIIGGIALIRRAEERINGGGVSSVGDLAAPAGIRERVRNFDLNRLNWIGWLLFFGTLGFVAVEIAVLVWLIELGNWDRRLAMKVGAPLIVFLAIGFFASSGWLLGQLGVSIYRQQRNHAEPPPDAPNQDKNAH